MTVNRSAKSDVRAYADRRGISYTEALRAFEPHTFRVPTAEEWENAFIRNRVVTDSGLPPMYVRETVEGQLTAVTFHLPTGINDVDIVRSLDLMRAITKCDHIEVASNGRTVVLRVAETTPTPPMPPEMNAPTDVSGPNIPFAVRADGSLVKLDVDGAPNVIVYGATGSCKTTTLRAIIDRNAGVTFAIAPDSERLAELGNFDDEHAATTLDAAKLLTETVRDEVLRRRQLNAEHNVSRSSDLPAGLAVSPIILVIDGTAKMSRLRSAQYPAESDTVVHRIGLLLFEISASAAATDVRVIAATTLHAGGDPLTGSLRLESARLVLGPVSVGERSAALRNPGASPQIPRELYTPGVGIWEPVGPGKSELVRLFTPS